MKDERHETIEQSVTDCNGLGNEAKMREALAMILGSVDHLQTRFDIPKLASEEILELKQTAESALSAPPRNCDIGTPEEQSDRFYAFCGNHRFQSGIKGMCSSLCPCIRCRDMCNCLTKWSQMPYEKGGAK